MMLVALSCAILFWIGCGGSGSGAGATTAGAGTEGGETTPPPLATFAGTASIPTDAVIAAMTPEDALSAAVAKEAGTVPLTGCTISVLDGATEIASCVVDTVGAFSCDVTDASLLPTEGAILHLESDCFIEGLCANVTTEGSIDVACGEIHEGTTMALAFLSDEELAADASISMDVATGLPSVYLVAAHIFHQDPQGYDDIDAVLRDVANLKLFFIQNYGNGIDALVRARIAVGGANETVGDFVNILKQVNFAELTEPEEFGMALAACEWRFVNDATMVNLVLQRAREGGADPSKSMQGTMALMRTYETILTQQMDDDVDCSGYDATVGGFLRCYDAQDGRVITALSAISDLVEDTNCNYKTGNAVTASMVNKCRGQHEVFLTMFMMASIDDDDGGGDGLADLISNVTNNTPPAELNRVTACLSDATEGVDLVDFMASILEMQSVQDELVTGILNGNFGADLNLAPCFTMCFQLLADRADGQEQCSGAGMLVILQRTGLMSLMVGGIGGLGDDDDDGGSCGWSGGTPEMCDTEVNGSFCACNNLFSGYSCTYSGGNPGDGDTFDYTDLSTIFTNSDTLPAAWNNDRDAWIACLSTYVGYDDREGISHSGCLPYSAYVASIADGNACDAPAGSGDDDDDDNSEDADRFPVECEMACSGVDADSIPEGDCYNCVSAYCMNNVGILPYAIDVCALNFFAPFFFDASSIAANIPLSDGNGNVCNAIEGFYGSMQNTGFQGNPPDWIDQAQLTSLNVAAVPIDSKLYLDCNDMGGDNYQLTLRDMTGWDGTQGEIGNQPMVAVANVSRDVVNLSSFVLQSPQLFPGSHNSPESFGSIECAYGTDTAEGNCESGEKVRMQMHIHRTSTTDFKLILYNFWDYNSALHSYDSLSFTRWSERYQDTPLCTDDAGGNPCSTLVVGDACGAAGGVNYADLSGMLSGMGVNEGDVDDAISCMTMYINSSDEEVWGIGCFDGDDIGNGACPCAGLMCLQ